MIKKFFLIVMFTLLSFSGYAISGLHFNVNARDINSDSINNAVCAEADGLYDPEILELYESTTNVEEVFLRDYYAPVYFKNLRTNFGNNSQGSCGYVATGMLLSFWDTYWDDGIIEEAYDVNSDLNTNYFDFSVDSPGIEMEPSSIANVSDSTYHSNISEYSDEYFQFLLISMGDELYGTSAGSYGMFYDNYSELFNHYVYEYKEYTTDFVEVIETSTNVRAKTIELIKQGIPVKLGIEGHAVVAYDYDEENDDIYCHFGWGANTTHVTIESMGYSSYNNLFAFNFNYIDEYNQEQALCICSSVIPSEIEVDNYYLDYNPTYKWNSLIKEKWFANIGLYHELSILDSNRHVVYTKEYIFNNEYTLNSSEFASALNLSSNTYYINIGLTSVLDSYWDDYYCNQSFKKPNRYYYKSSFLPSDWGFIGRYYFENELTSEYLVSEPERKNTITTINGLTITTDRLRCGYIENSYIVLSPRRENAGRAYFEMNFDKPVYSFMYRACMWSSSENLDGIAIIQVKDAYGNWTTLKDIPIASLKTKENGLTQFIEQTPQGIYGLRFETTATATGTRNKGRLCIDDIVFSTTSGTTNNTYVSYNYSTKIS